MGEHQHSVTSSLWYCQRACWLLTTHSFLVTHPSISLLYFKLYIYRIFIVNIFSNLSIDRVAPNAIPDIVTALQKSHHDWQIYLVHYK